jgi:hypothetical protein
VQELIDVIVPVNVVPPLNVNELPPGSGGVIEKVGHKGNVLVESTVFVGRISTTFVFDVDPEAGGSTALRVNVLLLPWFVKIVNGSHVCCVAVIEDPPLIE